MLRVLVVRTRTPAYPGTVRMLEDNPDGTAVCILGCESVHEARGICQRESVDVVLVQHDEDALALSKDPPEAALALSSHTAIQRACDKVEILRCAQQLGLPYPDYAIVDHSDQVRSSAYRLGYPERDLVLRPSRAWGARGLCVLTARDLKAAELFGTRPRAHRVTLQQLEAATAHGPRLVMTEYLPGKEFSVDAFCGQQCEVAIPRERVQVYGGVAMESVLDYRLDLQRMTLELAHALGLQSCFGMQFRLDIDDVPRILECNPRIQGTIIASHLSGVNLIWLAVQEALGDSPSVLPKERRPGYYVRPWAS